MGCGASDMRPLMSLERQQHSALTLNAQTVESMLSAPAPGGGARLCVGVFGLRSGGKSSLLHSMRAHLSAPSSAAAAPAVALPVPLPLPPPTEHLELFTGAIGDTFVSCVDTPGLPCGAGVRGLMAAAVLPRLHRLLWVVDSAADWNLDCSAMEMMQLWREAQQRQQQSPTAGAASVGNQGDAGRDREGLGSPQPSPAAPTLHIVCTKQTSSTPSPDEIGALMRLSSYFPAQAARPTLHGWSCEWEGARKEAAIAALLGSHRPAPVAGTGGIWASRRPSLLAGAAAPSSSPQAPSPAPDQGAANPTASLMSSSHVHLGYA